MAEETKKRKADHIRICLDQKAQAREATTGFEDVHLIHKALPEIDRAKIDLSTTVFGYKFSAPIIVGAMTGGTEEATKINGAIAEAVEKLHLGMGVGSQTSSHRRQRTRENLRGRQKESSKRFPNRQYRRRTTRSRLWGERGKEGDGDD